MNSREISLPLRRCRPTFIGVYGADDLRRLAVKIRENTTPLLFVVNVHETTNRAMGHWVTFYVSSSILAFLDSFALPIESYGKHFRQFKTQLHHLTYLHLPYRVQSLHSLTCGAYAVYFVSNICKHGLKRALQHFFLFFKRGSFSANDKKVLTYVYKFLTPMPACIPTFGRKDCQRLKVSRIDRENCKYIYIFM